LRGIRAYGEVQTDVPEVRQVKQTVTECSISTQNAFNYCILRVKFFFLFVLLIPFVFPTNYTGTCSH